MSLLASSSGLSDRDLLTALERVAADDRRLTAELLELLGELDARRLYLAQSCASLFTFCTQALHFSEHAAYHRIEAARAAREFPVILEMIADGALTLTSVALLRPHLNRDNHLALLEAARHKSKREVEQQLACRAPKPDAPSVMRRLAAARLPTTAREQSLQLLPVASPSSSIDAEPPAKPGCDRPLHMRARVEPISPERYLLKLTISAETHAKLRRAQDLMRHTNPSGDPSVVIERALTILVERLEQSKFARVVGQLARRSTRSSSRPRQPGGRYIPAAIRRDVWRRDGGRCAFVGARGRCRETGRLEFHHLVPFADGGETSVANLALRCQAHNGHEAELWSPTDAFAEIPPAQ
jgi:hypothetical protein